MADLKNLAIGVGPVIIPGKLDRPMIVTITAPNEIRLNDFAGWGDSLSAGFSQVLAENLSILLNIENIAISPGCKRLERITRWRWISSISLELRGDVLLRAWWTVFGKNGRAELLKRYTHLKEPAVGDDITAMVQAQSRAVEALSRQIAGALKVLSQKKKQGMKK